ncbi:MAG: hypothetical protein K6E84_03055 [Lachnospiraceae bacterium]|nr:hypothetical protein [Lachnospiraceae bacterium]
MEREKKTFVDWIKKHKRELLVAGVSIAAIIAMVIGIKERKALEEAWSSLRSMVEKTPEHVFDAKPVPSMDAEPVKDIVKMSITSVDKIPHDVAEHLRNLPEGWKASAQKIATAADHGYDLLPGQTWVEAYRTGGLAA